MWSITVRNIITTGATRCQILRLKCTKFDFSATSDPARGAYNASQAFLAVFKGHFLRGGERKGWERGAEGKES